MKISVLTWTPQGCPAGPPPRPRKRTISKGRSTISGRPGAPNSGRFLGAPGVRAGLTNSYFVARRGGHYVRPLTERPVCRCLDLANGAKVLCVIGASDVQLGSAGALVTVKYAKRLFRGCFFVVLHQNTQNPPKCTPKFTQNCTEIYSNLIPCY